MGKGYFSSDKKESEGLREEDGENFSSERILLQEIANMKGPLLNTKGRNL